MYISEIKIDGYKNCNIKSTISFNPGLNILVGENASGKTTIIDAIRMILRDSEQKYVTEDDFYKSFDNEEQRKNVLIDLKMGNLSPEERITFLSWCNAEYEAELHLEIEKEPNQKGYSKKVQHHLYQDFLKYVRIHFHYELHIAIFSTTYNPLVKENHYYVTEIVTLLYTQ